MRLFNHTSVEPGMFRGWFDNGESVEITWNRWSLAAKLFYYEPDEPHINCLIHVGPLAVYFPTWWRARKMSIAESVEFSGQGGKSWGIGLFGAAVHFNWGHRCKIFDWPFINWHHVSHEVLTPSGEWVTWVGSWEDKPDDGRKLWWFDYQYILKSGDVQHRKAEVYHERRTARRKWLPLWFPFAKRVTDSIHIEFSGEVGERTGSWKGGVMGCGADVAPYETVEQAFRRFEAFRKFN